MNWVFKTSNTKILLNYALKMKMYGQYVQETDYNVTMFKVIRIRFKEKDRAVIDEIILVFTERIKVRAN